MAKIRVTYWNDLGNVSSYTQTVETLVEESSFVDRTLAEGLRIALTNGFLLVPPAALVSIRVLR